MHSDESPSLLPVWWDRVEPARLLPKTPQEDARTIPARYHREARYHTNEPGLPLWKQALRSVRAACPPTLFKGGAGGWNLEYIVITDRNLAVRLLALLVKHRPQDFCLDHHLCRTSELPLPTVH